MEKNYCLTNIGNLLGILNADVYKLCGKEMANIHQMNNAFVEVENGIIVNYGKMSDFKPNEKKIIDVNHQWVMPGFVDSHTHMVFAHSRHNEYVMRLQGKTYEDIAAAGGGILNSAKQLANMSEDELFNLAKINLNQAILTGTTAIEIKSGYGLSVDAELKMLRVINKLKKEFDIEIKSTFLGAHAFPLEYKNNQQGYINLIKKEMLPVIAQENLADFIDVFCDQGFYSVDQTQEILDEAKKYNLIAKLHGNELGLTGGVQVAVKNNALSVDHLEHISEVEIQCLLQSDTMPVILPGSSFFLKIPYAPARQMIDAGLPVAVASDFNPGSSPHYNLWFTWSLACLYNLMLPAEVFNALTINAAYALNLSKTHGSITVGKKACLQVIPEFKDLNEIPYWFAQNHTKQVYY